MKKIQLIIFSLISFYNFAQQHEILWSQNIDDKEFDFGLIGYENDKIYLEKYYSNLMQGDRVSYKIINKDLKTIYDKKVTFKTDSIAYNYAKTLLFRDVVGQVVWNKNKKDKTSEIKFLYNTSDITSKNEIKKIFEISNKLNPIGVGLHQVLSPDKSKLLVYVTSFEGQGIKQDLYYKVIETSTMKLLNEGSFAYDTNSILTERKEIVVDNFGTIIQLSKYNRPLKEIKAGLNDEIFLDVIDVNNQKKKYVINEGILQHSHTLKPLLNGNYALFGITSINKDLEFKLFFNKIKDLDLEVSQNINLGNLYKIENDKQKTSKVLPYIINNVFFMENGNISVLLEQSEKTLYNYGTVSARYSTKFGNILSILSDKDLKLKKMTTVQKQDYSGGYKMKLSSDMLATLYKNKVYVLYEDLNSDNANQELYLWSTDFEGNETRELLIKSRVNSIYPILSHSMVGEKNLFVLKSENKIGLLDLEK